MSNDPKRPRLVPPPEYAGDQHHWLSSRIDTAAPDIFHWFGDHWSDGQRSISPEAMAEMGYRYHSVARPGATVNLSLPDTAAFDRDVTLFGTGFIMRTWRAEGITDRRIDPSSVTLDTNGWVDRSQIEIIVPKDPPETPVTAG